MSIKAFLKSNATIKKLSLWLISSPKRPKPRLWIRLFVTPFVHTRGKGSIISRRARMDIFPYNKFSLGKKSLIEDFTVINNGAGDVLIGDHSRIGIGSVVIGPVRFGNKVGLGQHVFISGFNHGYKDGHNDSNEQPLDIKPVILEDDVHIGANVVVVAGVTIGTRTQVGAGSVVTKSLPPFSVAVGNPAKVIKRFNHDTNTWDRI